MRKLIIDLETRSAADLKKVGAFVYAADPTTSITHIGYKNGADVHVWRPGHAVIPNSLADALADERVILIAHNAAFERAILTGPPGHMIGLDASRMPLERFDCTAARGARLGLPRDLAGACKALALPIQKDLEGHRLMMRVSRPRTREPLTWWSDESRMTRMADYCRRDVLGEAELDRVLPPLSTAEREIWLATERLDDRGVRIDEILLRRLIELSAAARHDLNTQIAALTDGAVPKTSNHKALTRWLIDQGVDVEGSSKDIVAELLENDDLDALVREVLELRQEGNGSSAQKADAIARQLSADGRIRGALIYGGAPSTLRWSSHGAQLHNLPRHNKLFSPSYILRDLADGATLTELAELHGPPLKVVSEMLRPVLIAAPGKVLIAADYEQIEARVLAWFAGQDDRLDVFRAFDAKIGPDPYVITATKVYQVPVIEITKDQRQIGKVADLALGYQGGARAFRSMAKNFGLKIPNRQAEEVKFAWREAHPFIVDLWWHLNAAAKECLLRPPGESFPVGGRLEFRRNTKVMTLRLPSGRRLYYWRPSLKEAETPWGEMQIQPHYWSQDPMTRQWTEFKAYGGLFTENATQATARDLLADALVRLDAAGLNPVLTVHDEALCEAHAAELPLVEKIMKAAPAWAGGLPIAVKVTADARYLKE